jgi:hypothetical protein
MIEGIHSFLLCCFLISTMFKTLQLEIIKTLERRAIQFIKRILDSTYLLHSEQKHDPYFMVKIPLTHKIPPHILTPRKSNTLSDFLTGRSRSCSFSRS